MPIPQLAAFQIATAKTKTNALDKARGTNIARVDIALHNYWDQIAAANPATEIILLHGIVNACIDWLKKKYTKSEFTRGVFGRTNLFEELFTRRRREIKALAEEALDELFARLTHHGMLTVNERGALHFTRHKVGALGAYGHSRRELRPMGRDYQPERTTYEQSGKTKAISGSGVHTTYDFIKKKPGDVEGVDKRALKIVKKKIDALTPDDFRVLDQIGRTNMFTGDVNYLKKADRYQYMAISDGAGLLVDTSGNPITSHAFKVTAYAMDRYGNLFTKDADPLNGAHFFNHSSFNAGRDVISAGTLTINAGTLQVIDNNSGHYKPTRENLHNCLDVLAAEGIDLTNTIVNLYVFVLGVKQEHRYMAPAFLADMHSAPFQVT